MPQIEMIEITCGCGAKIIFSWNGEGKKPRFIFCRTCGKKHLV